VADAKRTLDQGGHIGHEAYLRRIDGRIHGGDPADGEIRGRTLIQATRGYRFSIPEGFAMQKPADKILISGPDGLQALIHEGRSARAVRWIIILICDWAGPSKYPKFSRSPSTVCRQRPAPHRRKH